MDDLVKKEGVILEIIADIYIFVMLLCFPLIVDSTGFFKILECKWHAYLIIGLLYIIFNILIFLYFLIIKKINYFRYVKFSKIQILLLLFLGINIISCVFSPFFDKYNLFVGVGRGEGLIMIFLYTFSFFFVSLFAKFKKIYILYFSLASLLLNTVAILQYIGFNPFNMYQEGIGTHNVSFMTTIGNIDFISAMYCMLLSVSFGAFVFLEDSKINKIIHLLSILFGFFIIGIINVSSGKVAFLGTLLLIFPFIIATNKRFSRFVIIIATILFSYCINVIINPKYHSFSQSIVFHFQINYIVILFLFVIFMLYFLAYQLYKIKYDFSNNKKIIKYFYCSLIGFIIIGLIFLYFFDFKSGILYEAHELLHGNFDDNFGTYRIFLWKRTLTLIQQFPIFGSGPDTFAIRFMAKYTADIAALGELTINDTAANVYLTMLINVGFVGLVTYLSFIFTQILRVIKNINLYSFVLLIAVICFLIQDFFNLWVVIVTPIFWLLLALNYSSMFYLIQPSNIDKN